MIFKNLLTESVRNFFCTFLHYIHFFVLSLQLYKLSNFLYEERTQTFTITLPPPYKASVLGHVYVRSSFFIME